MRAAVFLAQQGVTEASPASIRRVLDEMGLAPGLTDEGLEQVMKTLFDSTGDGESTS